MFTQTHTQTKGQNMYTIECPKCKRVPAASIRTGKAFMTHICHENCGNIYWTLQQCPGCEHPQATIFVEKPRYSELITCKHCKIEFYLFLCPQDQCATLFYKTKESYLMGVPLSCQVCKFLYKEVVCQCGYQVILNAKTDIIQGNSTFNCKLCKKQIIYTICTRCFKTNYHSDPLDLGNRLKCVHCKSMKQYVPCPKCGRTTMHDKFNYCKFYDCQFCLTGFQYSSCPFCSSSNFHFTQKPLGPTRKCSNNQCRSTYFILSCGKCQEPVYFEEFDTDQAREEDCPKCKTLLKFYFCKTCKKFNSTDSKCSNSKCPPPKQLKSYSREAKQAMNKKINQKQKQALNKKNQNYDQSQCKICLSDKKSCMVNNTCGHVMMCQACWEELKKKHPNLNNSAPCPSCRKIGVYTKTIKYIYQ